MGEFLEKALEWAKINYPSAPAQQWAAFANSVSYLCSGFSGGYGGPSVREHAVSHALAGQNGKTLGIETNLGGLAVLFPDGSLPRAGSWKFDTACQFAASICFGPIERLHFECYRTEHCFDDSPEDLAALRSFRA